MTASIQLILTPVVEKSTWARWLTESPAPPAVQTRAFVDRALRNLPRGTLNRLVQRLQSSDISGIDAVVYELVAFEVCRTFQLNPVFEPQVDAQRPDLSISVGGTLFFCDVFVTQRPLSTLVNFARLSGYEDAGQAAKKIADTIASKAAKYRALDSPLVIFAMFGSQTVELPDLECALYGSSVQEIAETGVAVDDCHDDRFRHGILCPPSIAPYSSLSAVVGCDWFDTLNRTNRGRRLRCVVYHHWRPRTVLPLGAFAPFCDLSWRLDPPGQRVLPVLSGDPRIVMSTTSDEPPQFGPYSTERPW